VPFTEAAITEAMARFPMLHEAEVRRAAAWVDSRPDMRNPSAALDALLNRAAKAMPLIAGDRPKPAPSSEARGTFRQDGSWNRDALIPSLTETHVRNLLALVLKRRIPPSDCVEIIAADPLLADAMPAAPSWGRFNAIIPNQRSKPYTRAECVEAAWAAAWTRTSAARWVKDCVLLRYKREREAAAERVVSGN